MLDHAFGRLPFAPDSRDYPLATLVAALPRAAAVSRKWPDNEVVWDQGKTGHCVGMGCGQWGNTLPVDDRWKVTDGHALYYESVRIGGVPNSEDGAQVRWGLKALAKRDRVASYHLAASYAEALAWVRSAAGGPCVIGINWMSGFDSPTASGLVHATGSVRGGHCLLMYGATASYAYLLNSWGPSWGCQGRCHASHADMAYIIDRGGGEAWVAVEKPLGG